jgi:hypothetical protein
MSTLEEVRKAEERMNELVYRLIQVGAADADNLTLQLKQATDDYAKAVHALRPE